jgi:hypothetical protein
MSGIPDFAGVLPFGEERARGDAVDPSLRDSHRSRFIEREEFMVQPQTRFMPTDKDTLKKKETIGLIAADKVSGTDIYSTNGDNLGEVEDIMIDKVSGKVAYAVVSFGGFLGIGADRRALPWGILRYDTDQGGYVVSAATDVLKNAPNTLGDDFDQSYGNPEWNSRLYSHFGMPPYWE